MIDPETAAALELVIARTGHEPYRAFCADGHPDREPWRAEVRRMAAAAWPPTPAPAPSPETSPVRESVARYRRLQRLAAACLYRERSCGCNPGKCWAGYGSNVLDPTRLYAGDCAACLADLPGLSA